MWFCEVAWKPGEPGMWFLNMIVLCGKRLLFFVRGIWSSFLLSLFMLSWESWFPLHLGLGLLWGNPCFPSTVGPLTLPSHLCSPPSALQCPPCQRTKLSSLRELASLVGKFALGLSVPAFTLSQHFPSSEQSHRTCRCHWVQNTIGKWDRSPLHFFLTTVRVIFQKCNKIYLILIWR